MPGCQQERAEMFDKAKFIEQCLEQSRQLDASIPCIREQRAASRERVSQHGFPKGNSEHWKYSNPENFIFTPKNTNKLISTTPWRGSANSLNFDINGVIDINCATKLPEGLSITRFSKANSNDQKILEQHFDINWRAKKQSARYPLTNINTSLLREGLLIHVKKDASITPLLNLNIDACEYQRVLVVLESGSKLQLIEQISNNSHSSANLNLTVECSVAANANLHHSRILPKSIRNEYIFTSTELEKDARYKLDLFTLGTANRRNDVNIKLHGNASSVEVNCAAYADLDERAEIQVNMEHLGQDTQSKQLILCIAKNRARVSINGRIHIHQSAQHSNAALSNKNLLLHSTARINTKPELEIYADQVKCAHGATVGQINEQELFYLQSRGIDLASAQHMIAWGFLKTCLPDAEFRDYVESMFHQAFAA